MTRRFGIDTSVLVRLVTGDPQPDFGRCVDTLRALIEGDGDVALLVVDRQLPQQEGIQLGPSAQGRPHSRSQLRR